MGVEILWTLSNRGPPSAAGFGSVRIRDFGPDVLDAAVSSELTSIEEYHRLLAGATSEEDLLIAVETRLTLGRWRWHHIRRADLAQQQGDPGWPDVVAVRGDTLLVRELKAQGGSHGTGQREWLAALAAVTRVSTGTWRPQDMAEIERVLR